MTIIVVNKTTKSETLMKIENVMIRNLVKVKAAAAGAGVAGVAGAAGVAKHHHDEKNKIMKTNMLVMINIMTLMTNAITNMTKISIMNDVTMIIKIMIRNLVKVKSCCCWNWRCRCRWSCWISKT